MHIRFSPVDDYFIKSEVENGLYTNETELVRDAVRRMREEKERIQRFQHAVNQGIQAVNQGNTVPLTSELLAQIKNEAIRKAQTDTPYHRDDALPKTS